MEIRDMAKVLGRRGGLSRAHRLSSRERTEIARMGGRARADSLSLAGAIKSNFDYLEAMHRLHHPTHVRSESACNGPLPRLYGRETED
jgi:hypothetical protein